MFDLQHAIRTIGLFGVFAVVFAETGLLIGFFLPGDSLLFTAGLLASQGFFDITALSVGCFAAAVLGNFAAYAFGARVGRRLFERPNSRFFKQEHLVKAHAFYTRLRGAEWMQKKPATAELLAWIGCLARDGSGGFDRTTARESLSCMLKSVDDLREGKGMFDDWKP